MISSGAGFFFGSWDRKITGYYEGFSQHLFFWECFQVLRIIFSMFLCFWKIIFVVVSKCVHGWFGGHGANNQMDFSCFFLTLTNGVVARDNIYIYICITYLYIQYNTYIYVCI